MAGSPQDQSALIAFHSSSPPLSLCSTEQDTDSSVPFAELFRERRSNTYCVASTLSVHCRAQLMGPRRNPLKGVPLLPAFMGQELSY